MEYWLKNIFLKNNLRNEKNLSFSKKHDLSVNNSFKVRFTNYSYDEINIIGTKIILKYIVSKLSILSYMDRARKRKIYFLV